ncbi:MAG: glycoside hydrolase family 88 protein [Pirellulales bacterium]
MEIQKRLARTPQQIAEQLLESYGKQLPAVQYIPALALVGRLRHERNAQGDGVAISPDVLKAVMPYVDGKKPALDTKANGSTYSGHLIFAELAGHPGTSERDRFRCVELVKAVGDRAFDTSGKPLDVMPSHSEMSDAVFMAGPILAFAGKLTGDDKYYEASVRNMKFMQKLCLRDDGIYRHSPLDEAAWGRGNGFPTLGLTWTLDALPESFAGRSEVAAALEKHLRALLPHQDHTGMWHQVIDKPESYAEFTSTAMITYAMVRGVREGRLDAETFDPPIRRAWEALKSRIAADGTLIDVCTGTGKQNSLRALLRSPGYSRPRRSWRGDGSDDRDGDGTVFDEAKLAGCRWWLVRQCFV